MRSDTMAQATQAKTTASLNLGALFPSRNGSTVCPYIGIVAGELLEALPAIDAEYQWRLFTQQTDAGLQLYAAVTARTPETTAPYLRAELGLLIRNTSDTSPYRLEPSAELAEAAGPEFPSGITTWRKSEAGNDYLTLWMPAGGSTSAPIARMHSRSQEPAVGGEAPPF